MPSINAIHSSIHCLMCFVRHQKKMWINGWEFSYIAPKRIQMKIIQLPKLNKRVCSFHVVPRLLLTIAVAVQTCTQKCQLQGVPTQNIFDDQTKNNQTNDCVAKWYVDDFNILYFQWTIGCLQCVDTSKSNTWEHMPLPDEYRKKKSTIRH